MKMDLKEYLIELNNHITQIELLTGVLGKRKHTEEVKEFILYFEENFDLEMLREQIKKLKSKMVEYFEDEIND